MARTKQTAEKKQGKPKYNKKVVKSVIKRALALHAALSADVAFVKSIGGKSSKPINEVRGAISALDSEIQELGNVGDQDDQNGVDYCLNSMTRVLEDNDVIWDDGVDMFFGALADLDLKSKTAKLIGEENVSEYISGLSEELVNSEEE